MIITRTHEGISLSEIVRGYLVERLYIGYTMTQAKKCFRKFVKACAKAKEV